MSDAREDAHDAAGSPRASDGGLPHPRRGGDGSRRRWPSLAQAFDPRRNALTALRLALAATVALTHGTLLGFGWQPVWGSAYLGDLAVDAFFVVSGFLVARSYLRLGSLRRYLWHRCLRIVPGFWACLLVVAGVVAPVAAVLSGRPAASVLTGEDTALSYVTSNALLRIRQLGVDGVGNPANGGDPSLDGSLWSLFYEALCYGLVAALGVVGVLRARRWAVLALCAGLWAATVAGAAGADVGSPLVLRLTFVFLLGSCAFLFAERVPVSGALAALCLPVIAAGLHLLEDHRALAGPAFAYLLLWAVVRVPLRRDPRWDLSYGLYIYHWPVYLLLSLAGAGALGTVGFTALGLLLATGAAAASWVLVEAPALRLKDAALVELPLPGRAAPSRRGG
ncbi:acyltransferase family protein [Kineococcus arenarius]|uniref:acyltransferase family protein n=1 Tax=unclassified Kineococcus TaxID=2621656 RepID=UPI003D7D1E67